MKGMSYFKKNDKGMAMVSAIIIIALLAIMAGTLMQMSYLAYTRKVTERRSNETFYTAESCIDTIKAAVQNKVAGVIEKAKDGTNDFVDAAYEELWDGDKDKVEEYLYNQIVYENGKTDGNLKNDSFYYHGYKDSGDFTTIKDGISSAFGGDFSVGSVEKDYANKALRIKDVHVLFVNKQGYVAEITTDIVVHAPKYASDVPIQTGSYSMFAGSGVTVKQSDGYHTGGADGNGNLQGSAISNAIYLHQEGNLYSGFGTYRNKYGKEVSEALYLEPNGNGGVYFSVGGTNAIFNGDVYVTGGSTLIFTGGDGTEDARVDIRGRLYLSDGATVLLAKNVYLNCQGIYVIDDISAETWTYTEYTGKAAPGLKIDDSLSQFYPYVENAYMKNKMGTTYSASYLNQSTKIKADVSNCFLALGTKLQNEQDWLEDRALMIGLGGGIQNDRDCGIYMLKCDSNSTVGWKRKSGDKYYLVKYKSKVGDTSKYMLDNAAAAGMYDDNIYVNPKDLTLNLKEPVGYGEDMVDYEYAQIFNMPMVDLWKNDTNSKGSKAIISGYDTTNKSSYNTKNWSEVRSFIDSSDLKSYLDAKIAWDDIKTENDDSDQYLGNRKFRIPSGTFGTIEQDNSKLSFETIGGNKYGYGLVCVGKTQGDGNVVNTTNNEYYLDISQDAIKLHATGGCRYVGLFLTSENCEVGFSSGISRGISILEAAKETTTNAGLNTEGNPVREILKYLSGKLIDVPLSRTFLNGATLNANAASFCLLDNVFNGGIEALWQYRKSNSNDGGNNPSGNGGDFVEVDNWNRD